MTIYGETDDRFRPRPAGIALLLTALAQTLVASALAPLLWSAADLLVAQRAGLNSPQIWFAPLAGEPTVPHFHTPPLSVFYGYSQPIACASGLVLALLLVLFWPTGQRLATRLFIHTLATCLVLWVVLAPAFSSGRFRGLADITGLSPSAWTLVALAAGALAVFATERRNISLLTNVFSLQTASLRLSKWIPRVAVPFAFLAFFSFVNDYTQGLYAVGVAAAASLAANLLATPRGRFEETGDPTLRQAAFGWPIAALLIAGASMWAFGFAHPILPRRAVVVDKGKVSLAPMAWLPAQHPLRIDELRGAAGAAHKEAPLEIHWSKERKKQ